MNSLILFLFILPLLSCEVSNLQTQWSNFKIQYGKTYHPSEEDYKFQVFQENLKKINEHNAKYDAGLVLYRMGVNQFTDMSDEDFNNASPAEEIPAEHEKSNIFKSEGKFKAPLSKDWRKSRGVVTPIKNQGHCGSCYAFTAVAVLESHVILKHRAQGLDYSEQAIIDCSEPYGNHKCNGGGIAKVYRYTHDYGLIYEQDYPYAATNGTCKWDFKKRVYRTKGLKWVSPSEDELKEAVGTVGPVGVSVDNKEFRHYANGIFEASQPYVKHTHTVAVVGYGTENGVDYWIVKNSYSTRWGENGFARIRRNPNYSIGLDRGAIYPDLY